MRLPTIHGGIAAFVALSLTACGGGGGGDSGSDPAPLPVVTPSFVCGGADGSSTAGIIQFTAVPQDDESDYRGLFVAYDDGSRAARLDCNGFDEYAGLFRVQVSPDKEWVTYHGDREGRSGSLRDLFLVSVDGQMHVHVDLAAKAEGVNWAPSGDRFMYRSYTSYADYDDADILVVDADGSNPVKVSGDRSSYTDWVVSYQWSHDETKIAYVGRLGGFSGGRLYTVNPDGSDHRVVSNAFAQYGRNHASGPVWSPVANQLAYVYSTGTEICESAHTCRWYSWYEPWVVNADGTGRRRLAGGSRNYSAVSGSLKWSPDGQYLYYRMGAGSNADHFVQHIGSATTVSLPAEPEWAPDTSALAFIDASGAQRTLYAADADGQNIRAVVALTTDVGDFRWAPDSALLAYRGVAVTDGPQNLWTVSPDGSNESRLTSAGVAHGDVTTYAWSPASDVIAFFYDETTDDRYRLFVSAPDASSRVSTGGRIVGRFALFWSAAGDRIYYHGTSAPNLDDVGVYAVSWPSLGAPVNISSDLRLKENFGLTIVDTP